MVGHLLLLLLLKLHGRELLLSQGDPRLLSCSLLCLLLNGHAVVLVLFHHLLRGLLQQSLDHCVIGREVIQFLQRPLPLILGGSRGGEKEKIILSDIPQVHSTCI